ncbi:MBL fold metallo-hydrolase [Rubellimicrobium rubrum]|uniref:MBL fold metallo-hydrolase n=1 Tax=Rubellimicrobium rubrum TaxID=2585369 RepID=A0A5C4N3M6_9RHOB|nr:MBL fold metallo-hydrolase [Rubellimicrobium rubrum]TNC51122.1 MBL fold metallo-hydrolase [Rubellimicrobium rubrum]
MAQQIPISDESVAFDPDMDSVRHDHTHEVASDLAYRRLGLVNVVFVGAAGAADRNWVLIDAGLLGTAPLIRDAARARFGEDSRPAAILMTHGHFDHVGALEQLAEDWDVPVFAHPLERPYLDGSASYPPGDPTVGGGLMAALARLYPRKPVDVAQRLQDLPSDGSVPFLAGWRWVHTPGHSVGHVSFWRESDRTLIAGDAVVTTAQESAYAVAVQEPELHGPPMYFTVNWPDAEESVAQLADLQPDLLMTMHGQPLHGAEMREGLHRLAKDFGDLSVPRQGRYLTEPRRAQDGSAYELS